MKRIFSTGLLLITFLILMALSTGCATIMNGDMVTVPVTTHPAEANLFVAGREYKSPASVEVPRGKGDFKLQISKEGYKNGYVMLEESLDAWYAGNLLFGGVIGLVLDPLSGKAYDVEPEQVDYWLVKEGESGEGYLGSDPPDARKEEPEKEE
jgi:hypothetical protein